ncbi:MAG: DUF4159 domain-containing protein [Elusimicrobiota bacterium]|nr:DUF4159 domain-containing protein [Elusimicrobiota bacterium]
MKKFKAKGLLLIQTSALGAACLILLMLLAFDAAAEELPSDKFIFSQLSHGGSWDPYPGAHGMIDYYLSNTTSLDMYPERNILTLTDKDLFYFPFLLFTGRGAYPDFTEAEIVNLRRYLRGGGILFIDTGGDTDFASSVEKTFRKVFPDKNFTKIPDDHAVYRSFYLIDYVSGRNITRPFLTGMEVESRIAVIKSENDLPGVWPGDKAGNWHYSLVPGRPGQRKEALKLTLNILVYSVSGTYKSDKVHQPDIKRKLRRGR